MAKNRLPDGYKSAAQLLKEFREKHPEGVISTAAIVSNGDFVIVTATVKTKDLTATGIADADLQQGKGSSKAESAAIRRALVHLGFESVEGDDESEEQEERPKKFSRSRDEEQEEKPKKSFSKARDEDEDDEEQEEEEEKPRSRFASKASKRDEEESEEQDEEEGKPKFERGSRFKRG